MKEKLFLEDVLDIVNDCSEIRRTAESFTFDFVSTDSPDGAEKLQQLRNMTSKISIDTTRVIQKLLKLEKKYYPFIKKGGK